MKRLMGIMIVFVLLGTGCAETERVRVVKREMLHFQPGESDEFAINVDGTRVRVSEIGLVGVKDSAKIIAGKPGEGDHDLMVRVDDRVDGVVDGVILGLIAMEQMGVNLGEMRVDILRDGDLIIGVKFTGVVGEVVEGGVLFGADKTKKVFGVKFVSWGDEGVDDVVMVVDEVEPGVWGGMACVGVKLYLDEFVSGDVQDVFYLSVIDRDEDSDSGGGIDDLVVLFWDEEMSDDGMRFVMLGELAEWYEVWDEERLLRGYEALEDGGVGELTFDVVAEEVLEEVLEALEAYGTEGIIEDK